MYQRQYKPYKGSYNKRGGYGSSSAHQKGGYGSSYRMTPVTREQVLASLPPASIEQQDIISFQKFGSGDLIVNALAGSGKTTSCKFLAAYLDSDNAVYCVFSKALEIEIKPQLFGLLEIKTSYALGLEVVKSVLGEQIRRAGNNAINADKYRMLCKVQARVLSSQLRMKAFQEAGGGLTDEVLREKVPGERQLTNALLSLVNHCQMNLVNPLDIEAVEQLVDHHNVELPCALESLVPVVDSILAEGVDIARTQGQISFGDMVWLPYALDIEPRRKFFTIIVDEAQDINAAQRELLFSLRAKGGRMIWVGDRRQAIFGFASADAYSFDNIRKATGARELPLNTCYRCPQSAIRLAQEIVPSIRACEDAPEGTVIDISESELVSQVREGDMVLCRMTAPLITACLQMIARKIPARVKGKDVGNVIINFVEQVAEQPGFSYAMFADFLDRLVTKMTLRLSSTEGNEQQIETLNDTAEAVTICFNNFVECETLEELIAAIEDLFTDDRPGVTLSTVHRAKGLEAERVFILRPEKLPLVWKNQQAWQYEQELNLKYVALTRVKFNRKTKFQGELYFVRGA